MYSYTRFVIGQDGVPALPPDAAACWRRRAACSSLSWKSRSLGTPYTGASFLRNLSVAHQRRGKTAPLVLCRDTGAMGCTKRTGEAASRLARRSAAAAARLLWTPCCGLSAWADCGGEICLTARSWLFTEVGRPPASFRLLVAQRRRRVDVASPPPPLPPSSRCAALASAASFLQHPSLPSPG